MIEKITTNIYRIKGQPLTSNCYLINKTILIDTGSLKNREFLKQSLKKLKANIKTIILTHLHYDHCGNLDLFKDAKIYASKEEINNLKKYKALYVGPQTYNQIKKINILPIKTIKDFKIIKTPGHTSGSICLLHKDILFSGDTIFHKSFIGRTDLISASPIKMIQSLKLLKTIKYKTLCPGH
ncbi:MAG: MBL fold metallo-hydrolase [Nanoarchaeota archaeon]|nr:MBL fold metallo-hydrolase [Nanoarchaeota archaeon]